MLTFPLDPREAPKPGCVDLGPNILGSGGGCCQLSISTNCVILYVEHITHMSCLCAESCYYHDSCCDDILEIGCMGKLPIMHVFVCEHTLLMGIVPYLVLTSKVPPVGTLTHVPTVGSLNT